MIDSTDAAATLATVMTEHGALTTDEVVQLLVDAGITDPDAVIDDLLDEISCPAASLADDRWVWLPALLDGRVFTHRLSAAETTHDLLAITVDLDPVTELCEHAEYQHLADGSPLQIVLPDYDDVPLEERGIPIEFFDQPSALLLEPGTLT